MFTFLVVVSWLIIFPSVAGVLARKKDRSAIGWMLLVLFLTPIWILLLLALPTKGKTCPSCAETVKWDAQICRYCQHQFPTQISASGAPLSRKPMVIVIVALSVIGAGIYMISNRNDKVETPDKVRTSATTWAPGRSTLVEIITPDASQLPVKGQAEVASVPISTPRQPAPVAPASLSPPSTLTMYQKGLADRTDWENWLTPLTGPYRSGAEFWATVRNDPKPSSCKSESPIFTAGCEAAKARLTSVDVLRKSVPEYKTGWNAYPAQ